MTVGGRNILVMGIVNLTGDSFFSGSRMLYGNGLLNKELLRSRIETMIADGADILDIGACSTRPGSIPIGADEEWKRIREALPVILDAAPGVPLSIDTYHASVIERICDMASKVIANDISAGEADPRMLETVGRLGIPYVAMHMRGTPQTMQSLTDYKEDIVTEVKNYFKAFAIKADDAGIRDWYLDPGFGFAKTVEQNYALLQGLSALQEPGRPILVGLSRKSMIYKPLGLTPEECLPATQALNMAALERGASVLRVHDVAAAKQTVYLYNKLYE